jgi:hypothetical protein
MVGKPYLTGLWKGCPSSTQNRWQALIDCLFTPITRFLESRVRRQNCGERVQLLSRLRQTDFSHQFSVTRIGAQGIEREVGPEAIQQVAVFLVCGVDDDLQWVAFSLSVASLVVPFGNPLQDIAVSARVVPSRV